ncbi:hypothetical protein H312_03510 [Anncaliia algerae PRA339]|uniref:Uncharacterized protein n=1 Tax=Anncaliia algerae PRA339 TaxID=1288291 RepID=A0A059EWJ9_9MICR|nr:hypothetical protein H312_03510 [Anncaliia algerae PRA339]
MYLSKLMLFFTLFLFTSNICLTNKLEISLEYIFYETLNMEDDYKEFNNERIPILMSSLESFLDCYIEPFLKIFYELDVDRLGIFLLISKTTDNYDDFMGLVNGMLSDIDFILDFYKIECFTQDFYNIYKIYEKYPFKIFEAFFEDENFKNLGMLLICMKIFLKSFNDGFYIYKRNLEILVITENIAEQYNPYELNIVA